MAYIPSYYSHYAHEALLKILAFHFSHYWYKEISFFECHKLLVIEALNTV